jgi:acetyl-CoA C-acetyltransferase
VSLDPRTPVLVGAGQFNNRVDQGATPVEPVELIAEAARRAATDTGGDAGSVLAAVGSVRVVALLSWRYQDPGRLVAGLVGAKDAHHTVYTTMGGQTPQALVSRTCQDIAAGRADVVLVGGAEAWRTRMAFRANGERPAWTVQGEDETPTETYGADFAMTHPLETARGVVAPVQVYPVFECALRATGGSSQEAWTGHLGRLWSRFSEVAASNPNAWIQQAYSPADVVRVSADNRMIGFPYPKRLNSNNAVEQGAALLLCSAEAAERLGVPRERWVFPLAGADGADTAAVSARVDLRSSPAIRVAGRRAMALAGVGPDEIAHVDLYSCFPSAVQIAANELELGLERDLTVTGGLCFAGGPWNNYVTHSIAAMSGVLREHPGDVGLVSANGGFVTKHAFGLYSTEPPAGGFRWENMQAEIDKSITPTPIADAAYKGPGTVEAYTVMHGRDGEPETGICAILTSEGARTWATSEEAEVLRQMEREEFVGVAASVEADGGMRF